MRGHIQQRGKASWRLKVFVGRDATGVRRYVERSVRGTRREAERELARVVVEVDEGRHAASAPMTFGELLDRWLDVKRRTVEVKTIESYEWIAQTYVRPALGARRAASLRPIDLDALYADLHGRGVSSRTVRICHTVMRQSLEQARRWGLIARNPAVDATPPPQRRHEVDAPTVAQVQQLIEAARRADPDSPRTCGCWPRPDAGEVRRARCGGPTSTSSAARWRSVARCLR
jgi:integrase